MYEHDTLGNKINSLPYYTFNNYLTNYFGEKVLKVAVDSGLTCPNRDGFLGKRGCVYCDEGSHYSEKKIRNLPVTEQIELAIQSIKNGKKRVNKFLVYFQAYTGTYSTVENLRAIYTSSLAIPGVIGLSIATRPDCLGKEVLDLLEEFSKQSFILIELGVQTIHNRTLQKINRGHSFETTIEAIENLKDRGIHTCAHLILHLPGEEKTDMIKTARVISNLGVEGVKLHHLHILKNTSLHKDFLAGRITLSEKGEYINTVCDVLENLSKNIVIHRLAGDAPHDRLVAPLWAVNKLSLINEIINELNKRETCQGFRYLNS